jgi:hypothetical protein
MGYKESILQPLYDSIQLLCTAKVCPVSTVAVYTL